MQVLALAYVCNKADRRQLLTNGSFGAIRSLIPKTAVAAVEPTKVTC